MIFLKSIAVFFTKNKKLVFISFTLAYVLFHLWSANISPLPWWNDTFFASVVKSVMDGNGLKRSINPYFVINGHTYTYSYGPVYFYSAALFCKLFGFGITTFRVFGMCMGFVFVRILMVFGAKITNEKLSSPLILLLGFLFLTDPFFNSSIHSGRMESTSLTFLFCSLFFLWKLFNAKENKKEYFFSFLAALFFTLSILTTLRAAFIVVPIALVFGYYLLTRKSLSILLSGILFACIVTFIYSIWVFSSHGSYEEMIKYYLDLNRSMGAGYVGGATSFLRRVLALPQTWILIITSVTLLLLSLAFDLKKIIKNRQIIFILTTLISYYLVVYDTGEYSIYILPFYYLILIYSVCTLLSSQKIIFRVISFLSIALILGFNTAYFIFKASVLVISQDQRKPYNIEELIKTNLPSNSKIVGDELYYFAATKFGHEYQYMHEYGNKEDRLNYQKNIYDFDYLLVSNRLIKENKEVVEYYLENLDLTLIDSLKTPTPTLVKNVSAIGLFDISSSGYDGYLYKRHRHQ